MGILSSLFQTGAPAPQVAGPMLGTSKLPEELAPYYKDILGKAQALYNERTKEGYQPYQGPTIADFTPEQQQAFTGISGLVGQQAPVFQEAMDLTRTAAAPMTSEQMTQYMSPYQQAVVDIEKREATKQYESQVVPALAAKAATTGGFGGSRQAILEGMAADTQQRLLSDIQAKGSQQAYQDAVKRFQADRTAAGQAGAQLATMAPNQFKAQLGELGAIQTIGEEKQRQQQTALDEAFRQYQLERNYPYDTMSRYQSVVTGAPMGTTTFAQPTPPPPSTAQTLISGLGTLGATYGAFTGQNPLSLFTGKKYGGGLSDLPVVNADNGGLLQRLIDRYKFSNRAADAFPMENRGEGASMFPLTKGVPVQIDEEVGKMYDKYGNIFNLPDTIDEFKDATYTIGSGIKQIGSNIYDRSPNLPNIGKAVSDVDATSMEDLSALAGLRETPIRPPEVPTNNVNIPAPQMPEQLTNELIKPVQPALQDSNIQAIDENYVAPAGVNEAIALEQERNRIQNERAREAAERMGIINAEQDAIAQAEKAYMDKIKAQEGKYDERLAKVDDERTRDQYANLASFFARMGTTSPRRGGLLGIVDAGLQAAPESLAAMQATNKEARNRADSLQDSKDAAERLRLKEDLGMKVSARERRLANEKIEREEKQFAQSLQFKYDELDASIQDSIRDSISTGTLSAADYNSVGKMIGDMTGGDFVLGPDGKYTRIGGIDLTPGMQNKINSLMGDAYAGLARSGSLDVFNAEIAPEIASQINAILTTPPKPPNGDEDENSNDPKNKRNINKAKIILEK